jgi:hypothetical protein
MSRRDDRSEGAWRGGTGTLSEFANKIPGFAGTYPLTGTLLPCSIRNCYGAIIHRRLFQIRLGQ